MTHEDLALPQCPVHTSELQDVIFSLTRKSSDKHHNIKTLPHITQSGLVTGPNSSQSNSGPIYPLTVWQSFGANVYFEPKRVLKTAFNNPAGNKTSRPAKVKRSDRAIVVKVLSVLNGEKFVQLPELPRSSIHRSPRPLGSLSNPSISTRLSHAYLCSPEQRFANTRHIQDTRTKFGPDLPSTYGPTVCLRRWTEPTKLLRPSINCRSCNPLAQGHYSTNSNGNVIGSDSTE
ncbi:uncharacterized protein LOC143940858 [Lithobates pipiens]